MPGPRIIRVDEVDAVEVKAQQSATGRAGVHLRFLKTGPGRTFLHCHYDPGVMVEAHGHASDHALYVLAGSVTIGDDDCGEGTLVLLDRGAVFGPLVAGPQGTDLLEFYAGEVTPVPADPEGFRRLLAERAVTELPVDFRPPAR